MEKVSWKDSYLIGVESIDRQHQKLVKLINRLDDCSAEEFHEILAEVFEYAKYHFKNEEDYMQLIGYPDLVLHKELHENFFENIVDLSIEACESNDVKEKVFLLLTEWLFSHILKSDMQIRNFREHNRQS